MCSILMYNSKWLCSLHTFRTVDHLNENLQVTDFLVTIAELQKQQIQLQSDCRMYNARTKRLDKEVEVLQYFVSRTRTENTKKTEMIDKLKDSYIEKEETIGNNAAF